METIERTFYSLKEVRQITGLPDATLHYWEKHFEELNPRKDGHGNRYYSKEDIELIKRIKYLRDEMKITRIEAIRNELQQDHKQVDVRQRATEILLRLRKELYDIRANI
ncbi:MAG: MerR family transcriptional regulator [Paludibacteraceae bacterium]|nr:MerR family transcriptional regulator [Paludibacteraceae bacterium]